MKTLPVKLMRRMTLIDRKHLRVDLDWLIQHVSSRDSISAVGHFTDVFAAHRPLHYGNVSRLTAQPNSFDDVVGAREQSRGKRYSLGGSDLLIHGKPEFYRLLNWKCRRAFSLENPVYV